MYKKMFVLIIVFISLVCCSCSSSVTEFSVLTYNLYNLFDDYSDGGEYSEYNPADPSVWNSDLYHRRLNLYGKFISGISSDGPDILIFQEVETRRVLDDLLKYYLKGMGYVYHAFFKLEGSSIGNAVISRYPFKSVKNYSVQLEDFSGLRSVTALDFYQPCRFRLMVNHWKSRVGGAAYSAKARRQQSRLLANAVAEAAADGIAVIAAGDFNEPVYMGEVAGSRLAQEAPVFNYSGRFFREIGGDGGALEINTPGGLALSCERDYVSGSSGEAMFFDREQGCTYYFQGEWMAFDTVIVSGGFVDSQKWELDSVEVLRGDDLCFENGAPKKWSSYFCSGYSDHLPVLAKFYYKF